MGLKLPSFQNFARYAVVTNRSTPDYRWGVTAEEHVAVLFKASCEDSREAIAALVGEATTRKTPPKITSLIVRPPKASEIRLAKFFSEKPKFWFRECVAAIDMAGRPKNRMPPRRLLDLLLEYSAERSDIFALNTWTADYETSRLFIYFWHACDRKTEMVETFLSDYELRHGNVGHFRVLQNIDPADYPDEKPKGAMWLDHYFPEGPPKN